ncbi:MAG: DUF4290 domain-containing protein [Flavobacteriales bacterium]|nr:DUF4290 domain-containing protein [Flavobacteriales bacterium]
MEHNMDYNTQMEPLTISEYGRSFQEMVTHVCNLPDKAKRTELANTLIQVMINLNPEVKSLEDYKQKLWDHLYIISDYKLDVDTEYNMPVREHIEQKPRPIPYKDELIKFRFYGRNLQTMVEQALDIKDKEIQTAFINYIASFMVNSSRNWNDENLDKIAVIEHLRTLSKGQLKLTEDDLQIHIEVNRVRNKNGKSKNKVKKNNNKNNNNNGGNRNNNKNFKRR